jgi:hypothetical protein
VAVPGDAPVIRPEVELTFAIDGALLDHVPPVVASITSAVEPKHTEEAPVIAAGLAFTVTTTVLVQPDVVV